MPLPRAPTHPAPLSELAMDVITKFWVESSSRYFLPRLRHDGSLASPSPMCTLPRPALACIILSTPALGHGHHAGCTKPTVNPSRAIKRPRLPPFASLPLRTTSPTSQKTPRRSALLLLADTRVTPVVTARWRGKSPARPGPVSPSLSLVRCTLSPPSPNPLPCTVQVRRSRRRRRLAGRCCEEEAPERTAADARNVAERSQARRWTASTRHRAARASPSTSIACR
jgi:hypothetical protein